MHKTHWQDELLPFVDGLVIGVSGFVLMLGGAETGGSQRWTQFRGSYTSIYYFNKYLSDDFATATGNAVASKSDTLLEAIRVAGNTKSK